MKRVIGGTLGIVLGVPAILMVRPVLYVLVLRRLRRTDPQLVDGSLALAAIMAAITVDGYAGS